MKPRTDAKTRAVAAPGEMAPDEAPGEVVGLPTIPLLIAGPVASEEELLSVQQIALVTQWLRLFSSATMAATGRA